jgi:hypothetical protein
VGTVCAAIVLCAILAAPGLALVFSSSCDRFEIDGNSFGAADGTPDFVDDFNDGMLAPSWTVLLGTAEETGGAAVVHNPGASIQLGATQIEISTIENAVHGIENGPGTSLQAPTGRRRCPPRTASSTCSSTRSARSSRQPASR